MIALQKRIAALEQQRSSWHSGSNVIELQTNETIEAGLKRLGRDDATGCIVVRQVLDAADWCAIAKPQQAALVTNGGRP